MANYFLTYLTTAQTGLGVTDHVATLSAFTNETSNGTVRLGDLSNNNYIIRSADAGKRPATGQLFPRGVYNK